MGLDTVLLRMTAVGVVMGQLSQNSNPVDFALSRFSSHIIKRGHHRRLQNPPLAQKGEHISSFAVGQCNFMCRIARYDFV